MSKHIVNPLGSPDKKISQGLVDAPSQKETYENNVKILTKRFKKVFNALEANLKPKTKISKRGKLKGSRLHMYSYNNKLFTQKEDKFQDFNTTFVFLLDVSGSMSARTEGVNGITLSRLGLSKAILKALSIALKKSLKGKIKIEVLLKSCPESKFQEHGNAGFLSRVYSSSVSTINPDVIDNINYSCPVADEQGNQSGSSTPELLLGKAVSYFLQNYVKTKNYLVFNMTDGDIYTNMSAGNTYTSWSNIDNYKCMKKYFKGIPFISILMGYGFGKEDMKNHPNPVLCTDDKFVVRLETTISKLARSLAQ